MKAYFAIRTAQKSSFFLLRINFKSSSCSTASSGKVFGSSNLSILFVYYLSFSSRILAPGGTSLGVIDRETYAAAPSIKLMLRRLADAVSSTDSLGRLYNEATVCLSTSCGRPGRCSPDPTCRWCMSKQATCAGPGSLACSRGTRGTVFSELLRCLVDEA